MGQDRATTAWSSPPAGVRTPHSFLACSKQHLRDTLSTLAQLCLRLCDSDLCQTACASTRCYPRFGDSTAEPRAPHLSQEGGGSQTGPSRTGRHTRGKWRLPALADDDGGDCSPATRALRLPPLPPGATFGQLYELVLVVDSREQVRSQVSNV